MDTPKYPVSLSAAQGARIVGIGRTAIYAAIQRGEIPSLTVNGRIVIPTAKLCEMFGVDPVEFFGGTGEVSA
jgi:hypothetical protein